MTEDREPTATLDEDTPMVTSRPRRARRLRIQWSTTRLVITTVIAVVGTVASVIGVVQVLLRDTTNFSHLSIAAEVITASRSDWAVPADEIHQIPLPADGIACSVEQLDWLETHALSLQRRYLLTLSNKATEGSMLALTNLRSAAEVSPQRGGIHVLVICDPAGVAADRVYYGRIDADESDTPARHVQLEYGRPPNSAPEIPITYNLAPGESGQFAVELFNRYPSTGSLVVSVLHREERRDVEIDGTAFDLPSLLFAGDMYLVTTPDALLCRKAEAGALVDCTLEEIDAEVAAADR